MAQVTTTHGPFDICQFVVQTHSFQNSARHAQAFSTPKPRLYSTIKRQDGMLPARQSAAATAAGLGPTDKILVLHDHNNTSFARPPLRPRNRKLTADPPLLLPNLVGHGGGGGHGSSGRGASGDFAGGSLSEGDTGGGVGSLLILDGDNDDIDFLAVEGGLAAEEVQQHNNDAAAAAASGLGSRRPMSWPGRQTIGWAFAAGGGGGSGAGAGAGDDDGGGGFSSESYIAAVQGSGEVFVSNADAVSAFAGAETAGGLDPAAGSSRSFIV